MTDDHIIDVIQTAMKFNDWRDQFIVEVNQRITSVKALDDWKDQFMKEVNQKVSLIDMALREELINMKTVSCKYSGFSFHVRVRPFFKDFFFQYCSRKRRKNY